MTIKTIPLPQKSTKEMRDYTQAVKRGMDSYFVVQNGKGWYVRKASDQTGNGKLFATKIKAIDHAKEKAAMKKSEVIIFDSKGTLVSRQITK